LRPIDPSWKKSPKISVFSSPQQLVVFQHCRLDSKVFPAAFLVSHPVSPRTLQRNFVFRSFFIYRRTSKFHLMDRFPSPFPVASGPFLCTALFRPLPKTSTYDPQRISFSISGRGLLYPLFIWPSFHLSFSLKRPPLGSFKSPPANGIKNWNPPCNTLQNMKALALPFVARAFPPKNVPLIGFS